MATRQPCGRGSTSCVATEGTMHNVCQADSHELTLPCITKKVQCSVTSIARNNTNNWIRVFKLNLKVHIRRNRL